MALPGQFLAVTDPSLGGSLWPTLGRQIALPSLGATFGRNKSYCRVSVALSGPHLAVTNRMPSLGGFS